MKSSAAYAHVRTKGETNSGIVGVNPASGETDRQLVLKEKESNYPVGAAANRILHFAGKHSDVAYPF